MSDPACDPAVSDLAIAAASETHAVTVETIFSGVSLSARLLPTVRQTARAAASGRFLAAGTALFALALASFVAASVRAADQRRLVDAWTARGHEASTFVASYALRLAAV